MNRRQALTGGVSVAAGLLNWTLNVKPCLPQSSGGNLSSRIYATFASETLLIETVGHLFNGEIDQEIGSGFVVSPHGYALTCAHVILRDPSVYKEVIVKARPGSRDAAPISANIVYYDERTDIAILKLDKWIGKHVPVDIRSQIFPGDPIVVLGFPVDLPVCVSRGDVRGHGRKPSTWITDAPVNPGDSGGPVFNQSGSAVGLVVGGAVSTRRGERTVSLAGIRFFTEIDPYIFPRMIDLQSMFGGKRELNAPAASIDRSVTMNSGESVKIAAADGFYFVSMQLNFFQLSGSAELTGELDATGTTITIFVIQDLPGSKYAVAIGRMEHPQIVESGKAVIAQAPALLGVGLTLLLKEQRMS